MEDNSLLKLRNEKLQRTLLSVNMNMNKVQVREKHFCWSLTGLCKARQTAKGFKLGTAKGSLLLKRYQKSNLNFLNSRFDYLILKAFSLSFWLIKMFKKIQRFIDFSARMLIYSWSID